MSVVFGTNNNLNRGDGLDLLTESLPYAHVRTVVEIKLPTWHLLRQTGKAREVEHTGVCARRATPSGRMQRRQDGNLIMISVLNNDEDVKAIVETTAHRVIRMLKRRGVLDRNEYDDFAMEQPVVAGMTSASIIGLVSVGERAGQRVRRVLQGPAEGVKTGNLCFASRGFSLHAATRIAGGNEQGLENLCNYVVRLPLTAGSLQRISNAEWLCPYFFGGAEYRTMEGAFLLR